MVTWRDGANIYFLRDDYKVKRLSLWLTRAFILYVGYSTLYPISLLGNIGFTIGTIVFCVAIYSVLINIWAVDAEKVKSRNKNQSSG